MNPDVVLLESPGDPEPGGRKSFWAHLDDLRTALLRSMIALGIALILCLTFVDRLVKILEYPLQHIDLFQKPQPTVTFKIGGSQLGPYVVTRDQFAALPPGSAPHPVYQLDSVKAGGSDVVALRLLPETSATVPSTMQIHLHNFGPAEGFFVAFHVGLYAALVLASPFWVYFMGNFLLPALNPKERNAILPWLGWSLLLFLLGVFSTYFLLLPVALRASVEYSNLLGFDGYDWKADDYISFVTHFIFGMGLGFQFPIVVLFLVKLGVLSYATLAKYRRHVFVLSFILGAVLTTPEVITQVAMAIPLYLLYEICIWIAWYWERKKRKAGEATAA